MTILAPPPDIAPAAPSTTPPPAPTRLRNLPGLDGLRALAVGVVVLYHAEIAGVPGGFLGVEVFFVVSGYLITSLLLAEHERTNKVGLREFWMRRARRLLPALFVAIAGTAVLALLFARDAVGQVRDDIPASLFYVNNWWQIAEQQSYFTQSGRPPLLRHLWSLAVEEQFYLLFPLVFVFALSRMRRGTAMASTLAIAGASALLMVVLYEPYSDPSRVYYGTDTRLTGLLLGVAMAFVWAPQRFKGRPARTAGTAVDVFGVVGLLVLAWAVLRVNEFDPFVYRGGFVVVALATLMVIAAVAHPTARLGRILGWGPLVWIGHRSYGIYLWHWPVVALTRPGLDVSLDGWQLVVVRVGLTLGLAELSYRFVEQPIRHGALRRLSLRLHGHGPDRRRLLVRTAVIGTCSVVAVVGLVAAMASVRSTPELPPGLNAEQVAAGGGDPASPVATSVPIVLPPTSATTAPVATTTTVAAPLPPTAVQPPVPPAGVPPTRVVTTPITAVGDSVMLGAMSSVVQWMPAANVDAKVSRQFKDALPVLEAYKAEGALAPVIVVHLGSNGPFPDSAFDAVMQMAEGRIVVWVNASVPRSWEDLVNERLVEGVRRWPSARLADWHAASTGRTELFAADGFHVEPDGARLYASVIAGALVGVP